MVSAFLAHGPAHGPFPSNRPELVPNLLNPPLHRFVVRVDAELAARHEPGPLSDVGFMDPFSEARHLLLTQRELDLDVSLPTRRPLREEFQQHPPPVVAFHPELAFELVV